MKRYCKEVVICYDADEAGQKATARAIDILRNAGLAVKVVTVPDGKDPDEFIKRHGDKGHAAFRNLLDNSGNDMEYRLFKLRSRFDMTSPQGKLDYLNEGVKLLSELDNPMEREIYASRLSDETDVAKPSIMEQVNRLMKRKAKNRSKDEFTRIRTQLSGRDDKINTQHAANLRAVSAEENLIAYLVNSPDKLTYIHEKLRPEDFSTDFNRNLYEYFSRKISANTDPMTTISADFTPDEQSKVVRIVNSYSDQNRTVQALDEYIDIILEEASRPSESDIRNSTPDEFASIFSKLKDQKK